MKISKVVGYTSGVFDLFHVGHLNILRNAKSLCDHLIVGVSTDELVMEYKNKTPVIPFLERSEIVKNIKFVDTVIGQDTMDKIKVWKMLKYDIMFVGDDWFGTKQWIEIEKEFDKNLVKIVYFPYTKGTSSTMINQILEDYRM